MQSHNPILSEDLLRRCAERSAGYDRDNRFFTEDFADLKGAGYLTMAVPRELGGLGLTLAQVCREQRRLAYYAPATALGVNMHVYWVGLAADLWRQGDKSLEWLLKEAMAGEVFNAGHAERGNDLPALLSTSKAERVEGGFRIIGHKMFGSLAPVFTRYGMHAMWAEADGGPKIVHVFMPRETPGYRIVPAGTADAFVLGIFGWALMGFANVYHGIARRAIDLAVAAIKTKTALAVTRTMAYHPEIQHMVAQMMLAFDPIAPHIEQVAEDWSNGVDHGATWPAKIFSAKYHAVEASFKIVDMAVETSGGAGMFRTNELERLFRDARCGRFHPANTFLTHEIVAKTALGIDLGEQPRWG